MAKTKPAARPRPPRQGSGPTVRPPRLRSRRPPRSRRSHTRRLARLELELIKLQEWVKHAGLKVVVVFEGRDAAGKGGTIKRITQVAAYRAPGTALLHDGFGSVACK